MDDYLMRYITDYLKLCVSCRKYQIYDSIRTCATCAIYYCHNCDVNLYRLDDQHKYCHPCNEYYQVNYRL